LFLGVKVLAEQEFFIDTYETDDGSAEVYVDEDLVTQWVESIISRTLGFGYGLSLVLGLVNFFVCIGCCCRLDCCCCSCCKPNKIESAEVVPGLDDEGNMRDPQEAAKQAVATMKSNRLFYVSYLVCLLLFIVAAGLASQYASDSITVIDNGFDDVRTFTLETADFLCSDDEDYMDTSTSDDDVCEEYSVGDFAEDLGDTVDTAFVFAYSILAGFSGVSTYTTEVLNISVQIPGYIDDIEDSLLSMNDTINLMKDELANLSNPNNTGGVDISASLPSLSTLPSITQADLDSLDESRDSAREAVQTINSSLSSFDDSFSLLTDMQNMVDGVENAGYNGTDLRMEMNDQVDDLLGAVRNFTLVVLDAEATIADVQDVVVADGGTYSPVTALLAFLPGLVVVGTCLCAACCKSRKPLCLAMTFMFLVNGLYGMLFGYFLGVSVIVGDVCQWEDDILQDFLPRAAATMDMDPTMLMIVNATYDMLTCPEAEEDPPNGTTTSNNLADIVGVDRLLDKLNASGTITSLWNQMSGGMDSVQESLREMNSSVVDMMVATDTEISVELNATEISAPLAEVKADLPPSPLDRDDPADQAAFEAYYLSGGQLGDFTFGDYWVQVRTFNQMLDGLNGGAGPNAGPGGNFTNTTAQDISSTYYDSSWAAGETFDGGDTSVQVLAQAAGIEVLTEVLDAVVDANDFTYAAVVRMEGYVDDLVDDFDDIEDAINGMLALTTDILSVFTSLLTLMLTQLAYVDYIAYYLLLIADFMYELPDYTHCGFIGNFYEDFFQGTICTDMVGVFYDLGVAFGLVVFLMWLTHLIIGIFYPTTYRKRPVIVVN